MATSDAEGVMIRLLVVVMVAALLVWACSKKQESPQMKSAKESTQKAWESTKDAASHAGEAVKEVELMPGGRYS